VRTTILAIGIAFQTVFTIQVSVIVFKECTKVLAGLTIMAFIEQIIVPTIEVSSGFGLFTSAVTADNTAAVVQILSPVLETFKSGTDLIQVFNIYV
jgi:hypothetical protein